MSQIRGVAGVRCEQAWWAFTGGAEKQFGSLQPGQRADFIIVDRDPTLASPTDLRKTVVQQTWVGGVKALERK